MKLSHALVLVLTLAFLWACTDNAPGPVEVQDPAFAKGDKGPPGGDDEGTDADLDIDFLFPHDGPHIISDQAYDQGDGASLYEDNVCGVQGTLFGASGDAVMDSDDPSKGAKNTCTGTTFPRELWISYSDDGETYDEDKVAVFLNLQGIKDLGLEESANFPLNIGLEGGTRCESLRFRTELRDGTPVDADLVSVTRTTDTTWSVTNEGIDTDGDDVPAEAACFVNGAWTGESHPVTLSFEIRLST